MAMDLSVTGSAPGVAVSGGYGVGAVRQAPDLEARQARFNELSATALDTSGKSTEDQRVQAYENLHTMSVTGQMIGLGEDSRALYDKVSFDSDIGQRAQQLQRSYIQAANAGGQAGGAQAALTNVLASFDTLSSADQSLLFKTALNAADRTGAKPYADVQGWRDNMEAQLKVVSFMKDAGVVGPNGALDPKAAATKSVSDPKFAAALSLSLRRDNNSADWTQSVLQLFGTSAPRDTVQLSDAAKKFLSEAPASSSTSASAPVQPAYTQGSLVSRTA